jgi:hypothetical protein
MIARRQSYHSQTSRGSRRNAAGVASSSGRKLRHKPPLPRNVGTPLAAETPAPVTTVMRAAVVIKCASRSIAEVMVQMGRGAALKWSMPESPAVHVPVAAGPAYAEHIRRLASKFTATLKTDPDNRVNLTAVAVWAGGEKVGYLPADLSREYYGAVKSAGEITCQGRRAPVSAHEDTGIDLLLDLSGIARE